MRKTSLILILAAFLATASQAWAARGGPFDSSSGIGGLDPIRGTYQSVFRGENVIGFCFFSSAADLDSYGSSRGFIGGINVTGSVGAVITDKEVLVIFDYAGVQEFRRVDGVGFLDQEVERSFFPVQADGDGEVTFRVTIINRTSQVIDDQQGAEQVVTLETFDVLDPETIKVSGSTRQLSLEPSRLPFTVVTPDFSIGPVFLDPTNAEEVVNFINQVSNVGNNNN